MDGMITREMLRQLHEVTDGQHLITSLYLNVDSGLSGTDVVSCAEEILGREWTRAEESPDYTEEQKAALDADRQAIRRFLAEEVPGWIKDEYVRQIVLFSCQAKRFWQVYPLPRSAREVAVIDFSPYVRPLTLLLDEYKSFCVVTLDEKNARIYEMFLGSIEQEEKWKDLDRRVKRTPWRKKRQVLENVYEHFRRVAEEVRERFEVKGYDLLIVAAPKEVLPAFQRFLPLELQNLVAGTIEMTPKMTVQEILRQARDIEQQYEREEERAVVEQYLEALKEGYAVAHLQPTLQALMKERISELVVSESFAAAGYRCADCGYLSADWLEQCPNCGGPMTKVPDVVDDAVEEAIDQGVHVEHVTQSPLLEEVGYIGGFLRF